MEIVVQQVKYPRGFKNWESIEDADEDDFNMFREDSQSVLVSCFFVIGSSSFLATLANEWKVHFVIKYNLLYRNQVNGKTMNQ